MAYYMSVDGGGSKLITILFDDQFRLLGYGTGGTVNDNFDNYERIAETMRYCIDNCLLKREDIVITKLYISMPGPYKLFVDILESMATVGEVINLSEGMMGILSGMQTTNGIVALAGTGSGAAWIDGCEKAHIGGWGSQLGDQGSGFAIGRDGLVAVIKAYENWGPETMLYGIIMKELKLRELGHIIPIVYRSPSYRSVVASVAPLVSKAARSGDKVAIEIMSRAGIDMGNQVIALIRLVNAPQNIKITISGGAWKGCKVMYDTFSSTVKGIYPQTEIVIPLFEPVLGGLIKFAMESNIGWHEELLDRLKREFAQFLYRLCWI